MFTITEGARYDAAVIILLLAAMAAGSTPQAPPRSPAAAMVEAWATVRIVNGVRLHLAAGRVRDGFVRRDSVIRSASGPVPAKLVEFE